MSDGPGPASDERAKCKTAERWRRVAELNRSPRRAEERGARCKHFRPSRQSLQRFFFNAEIASEGMFYLLARFAFFDVIG